MGQNHKNKTDIVLFELAENFISSLGFISNNIDFINRYKYKFPYRNEDYVRNTQATINDESNGNIKMLYTRNFTQSLLEIYT